MIANEIRTVFLNVDVSTSSEARERVQKIVEAKLPDGWKCVALPSWAKLADAGGPPTVRRDDSGMPRIKVVRYEHPYENGYLGYIEPDDKSWILYVTESAGPLFYAHRAPDGRVLCEGLGPHNVPVAEHAYDVGHEGSGPPSARGII